MHKVHVYCLLYVMIDYFMYTTFQNAVPQKGGEVNLTLGGIDLNNSGRLACFLNLDGTCFISTRKVRQQTNLVVLPFTTHFQVLL